MLSTLAGFLLASVVTAAQAVPSQKLLDLMAQAKAETDLGNYDAAIAALSALVEAADAAPALRAEGLVRLGAARRGSGDLEGAFEAFERASQAPGLDRGTKALLVQALGGALPDADRWAEVWSHVAFTPERSEPARPTLSIVWPDVPPKQVYRGKPIAIDFKDADIQDVFRLMADVSGLNVVVSPRVRGRVTLKADNEPWDRILDRILAAHGLAYLWEDNVLLVSRPGGGAAAISLDTSGDVIGIEDVGCWLEGQFPLITASVKAELATAPRLYFKSSFGSAYYYVEMARSGDGFVGRLPRPKVVASPNSYYVQAVMNDGTRLRTREISTVVVGEASACPAGARLAKTGPDGAVSVYSLPQGLPPQRRFSGRRIDVDYSSRELREVLSDVAGSSGASLEIDPVVGGRVTLKLKQVRWDQAFDVVVWINGLDWAQDGTNLKVFPRKASVESR